MFKPHNFSWFVENKLAGFGFPHESELSFLVEQGITEIVNMTPIDLDQYYSEQATALNIKVHSIAIQEFCPPTLAQINEFLSIMEAAKGDVIMLSHSVTDSDSAAYPKGVRLSYFTKRKPIGVHCGRGHGRTGTMLACYLVVREGYSADDAIAETRRRRKNSIETRTQEAAVEEFYQSQHKSGSE